MLRRRRAFPPVRSALALAAAVLVTAGCTSGGGSSTSGGPSTGPRTTTPGAPPPLSLTLADNGATLHLTTGRRLHIALPTTYWTFHRPDPSGVLRLDTTGVATPTATCSGPPGTAGGCHRRTADYIAIGPGRTTVVATRVVCGEAMRCTGADGRFTVNVAVDGGS